MVSTDENAWGGAYSGHDNSRLDSVQGDFVGNYAKSGKEKAFGGAIANVDRSNIDKITGVFAQNSARGATYAAGGAIYNEQSTIGRDDAKGILNSSFYGNYASAANGKAYGGAIYSDTDINITADGGESVFAGNYVEDVDGKRDEAVYADGGALNLTAQNGGMIDFEDEVNGIDYAVNLSGDTESEVLFNNKVSGVSDFNAQGAVLHLGKNAEINTVNYKADNATMKLDIAVDDKNQTVDSGLIKVSGDVSGATKVIVNAETPATFEGAKTLFVSAPNDDAATAASFDVARVVGSPYMWQTITNANGETQGNHWYLSLIDEENKDYTYASEIPAYAGIHEAAVEQNRSIAQSVANGIAFAKSSQCYQESCGVAEILPRKQAWIDTSYENAHLKAPSDMEADIYGVTAGADVYRSVSDRAGVFAAYRTGKYDLSGKGKTYSETESDLKNKSWLGGLYYRYNADGWDLLGTAFAGKQSIDVDTADKIVAADTDAMQYGLSATVGKKIALSDNLNITPEAGIYYTMLDVDALHDNMGKSADFDTLHYLEAEFGAKLEYLFCKDGCTNRVYVKPSVIQTVATGDSIRISGRGNDVDVKSYKDQTLGRVELGGEFGMTSKLSGYAQTGVTFGNHYNAYDVNVGLSYAF